MIPRMGIPFKQFQCRPLLTHNPLHLFHASRRCDWLAKLLQSFRGQAERDMEPDKPRERLDILRYIGPRRPAHPVLIIPATNTVRDYKTDDNTFGGGIWHCFRHG